MSPPNERHTHSVLIGSSGTGTAYGAIRALRQSWGHRVRILSMDSNPAHLVTASALADDFVQVPEFASPDFISILSSILEKYDVDTYMPLYPEEIVLAARLRDERKISCAITVLAPPLKNAQACADKWALTQLLPGHGVRVPTTALASHPFEGQEFFLKRRQGTGSRGARIVPLDELNMLSASELEEWIVQETCSPPEVTVDTFYDPRQKFCHAICRERIQTKAGVCTKARLFMDAELEEYGLKIAEALHLEGSFCFQVMKSTEHWAVTDVNPRPGAATAMGFTVKNDFFSAAFAYHWGEDPRRYLCRFNGEYFVTRQYTETLMARGQEEFILL